MTHAEATAMARQMECFACGTSPCEPVHYPEHRGMGGDESMWEYGRDWIPGCRVHHDHLDKRQGDHDQHMIAQQCAAFYRKRVYYASRV